jgi:hypothetical protein
MSRLLFILLVCLSACKQFASKDALSVEYNYGNSILMVKNFIWGYGNIGVNQFSGDFETLDKEVFEALKGKTGTCIVKFKNTEKNKYGVDTTAIVEIGKLNIDELNRYQDWEYWHKTGGIKTLLYQKYIAPQENKSIDTDATATDSTGYFERLNQQTAIPTDSIIRKTYHFTYVELYPYKSTAIIPDNSNYPFEGIIKEVNTYTAGILMTVKIDKGEFEGKEAYIMCYPKRTSDDIAEKLLTVVKAGNRIDAECMQAGGGSFDLVAGTITAINNL